MSTIRFMQIAGGKHIKIKTVDSQQLSLALTEIYAVLESAARRTNHSSVKEAAERALAVLDGEWKGRCPLECEEGRCQRPVGHPVGGHECHVWPAFTDHLYPLLNPHLDENSAEADVPAEEITVPKPLPQGPFNIHYAKQRVREVLLDFCAGKCTVEWAVGRLATNVGKRVDADDFALWKKRVGDRLAEVRETNKGGSADEAKIHQFVEWLMSPEPTADPINVRHWKLWRWASAWKLGSDDTRRELLLTLRKEFDRPHVKLEWWIKLVDDCLTALYEGKASPDATWKRLADAIAPDETLPSADDYHDLEAACRGLLDVMAMQEQRESEKFHLRSEVARALWDAAKKRAEAALAHAKGKQ